MADRGNKMKILVVVPDSILGGISISAFNFSNEMIERGNEVIFLDMSGTLCEESLPNPKIKIIELNGKYKYWDITAKKSKGLPHLKHKLLGVIKKITIRLGLWYKLIFNNFVLKGEFDVAIAFRQCEPCYYFVLNCVNAKKKMGFVHGELKYMGDISSWQKYMSSFDKIAYVSNSVKNEFISTYPALKNSACTVYNMFDIGRIKKMSIEKPAVLFDKNKINIVTVARIDNEFKQIGRIVDICKNLEERCGKMFHWYVIGDGPDYDETIKFAEKSGVLDVLTFLGKQNNPHAFVKQCDFTVLTSKSEAYPMVVNESFILQKPVVAAKFDSVRELIADGQNGLITEQSVADMTNKILSMIENTNGIREQCTNYLQTASITNDIPISQFMNALEI